MSEENRKRISMQMHDMKNSLGSVLLNLELIADPSQTSGVALEAAQDALDGAKTLRDELDQFYRDVREQI